MDRIVFAGAQIIESGLHGTAAVTHGLKSSRQSRLAPKGDRVRADEYPMKPFGRRKEYAPAALPEGSCGQNAPLAVTDLFAGRRRPTVTAVRRGPMASQLTGPDVFSQVTDDWGRRQSLLGFSTRLRCEQGDGAGWEFHRGASIAADMNTGGRRLDEDDTTLQIVGLHQPCGSPLDWDSVRTHYGDVQHEDFSQLGEARFSALDAQGAPVCVFRIRTLVVRVRMTGTLANRQYTRVYALDVAAHIDQDALSQWVTATAHVR